ncbi:hypothetical protein GRF59_18800 [Paenibacillus sp. HJL G12]|uniref:Uncharacterized protein n=1 Tax=Paenibacillus dendrobii TaxID=2691084 RepID=A0A7X3LHB9_9BACL|nr:hypothetical protein [Paenibacillus dendrobii]MWV45666.1 hypothetical protein [Paenibacillus dendrobii]
MNTITYPSACSAAAHGEWSSRLPEQIRKAAILLMETDTNSQYFYKLCADEDLFQLLLIEQNAVERYTVCHCFSTDRWDSGYAYESLPLSSIQQLSKMAEELNITS